jgi:hypothetical protein
MNEHEPRTCKSGLHTWTDEASAGRCCNGWHRELRLDGPEPGDDLAGLRHVAGLPSAPRAVHVWVRDAAD